MGDDELIKADDLSTVRVFRNAGDLYVKKQQLESLAEASEILSEARARAAALHSEVLERAARDAIRGLTTKLLESEDIRSQALSKAAEDIVEVAQVIAEKIIGQAFAADPDLLGRLVREELVQQKPHEPVTLMIAPSAAERIADLLAALEHKLTDIPVSVELNDTLEANDFIIDSEAGRIDARLGTQLERIGIALRGKTEDE